MSNGSSSQKRDTVEQHWNRAEGHDNTMPNESSSSGASRPSYLTSGSDTFNMPGGDWPPRRDVSDPPPHWLGARQGQPPWPYFSNEGSTPVQASGGVFQSPYPNSPPYGSIYGEPPQVFNYGPVYNIGTAGNVWTGPNYGPVIMNSDSDGFILNLAERLKISVKADYRYYGCGDESALHRSSCTPGTRVAIIRFIILWATDMAPGCELVYWLSGQAGAGKTTIAYTICHQLEALLSNASSKVVLGASFFCSRQFPDTRSVSSIIRTIVYQLALRSKAFQAALKEHGRFDTVDLGPKSQLMGLLVEPWKVSTAGRVANNEPCYVIPIDAVDELEGRGGTEFLGTLFDVLEKEDLSGLKFFVTSRSDPALVERIKSFPDKQVCRLEEVPLEESSADIELYLNENLANCATTVQIQQLVSDAAGLFIFAATVVEYVKGRDVEEQRSQLKTLLSNSPRPSRRRGATAILDKLYLQILETSLVDQRDLDDPDVFQDCLSILHTFLCTIERTSTWVAIDILNASLDNADAMIDAGVANGVLHRLHAVLYSQGGQVVWYHKSFVDFLFDKNRSRRFFCNQEEHHCRLTEACFEVMSKQLRFNIGDIQSSYQLDSDNKMLSTRVKTNVSMTLRYVCANWTAHLILTSHEALKHLSDSLNEFLKLRILFWMEVMNLLGQRGRCQGMLRDAQRWASKSEDPMELVRKLADAAAFATYHSTSKAALSTPHLYVSSLVTFPRPSSIVRNWKQQFGGIPRFVGAPGVGGESVVASIVAGDRVTALAVSPDGVNIAVGTCNGSVQIWDLSTGEEVVVFKGHTNSVMAVAYSPDGTRVVSGGNDKSIRVWDLSTGEEICVLLGHIDEVYAVAYSSDGNHIISGSLDQSVRVWDLSTGQEPTVLRGHTSGVWAIAYAPDTTGFVSGARDNSVRVWDLDIGEEVRIYKGHTDVVYAVAYSPNGRYVVSGSEDKSVRVWDLSTGEGTSIMKGHSGPVIAVAYSSDGTQVISASGDKTIRVWDLSTGEEVRVLGGDTSSISAVAYSPDGTHAVCGSSDHSVRVWDLSTAQEAGSLRRPTDSIQAVAYSPDGTRVVSGSLDASVRVWDLSTREEVRIIDGHTKGVIAAAYSPDGACIVSSSLDKSIRVWNLSKGEQVWPLRRALSPLPPGVHPIHEVWYHKILPDGKSQPVALAYSPDGTHVVSGSEDKSVRVWDLSKDEEVRILKGHTEGIIAVAYSPDGTHIVSGSLDRSIRVWNISTGEQVALKIHSDSAQASELSRIREEWAPKGSAGGVQAVAYSPDGTRVAFGYDKLVRVWDLASDEVQTLRGHTSWVTAVAYSPDGTRVVSASSDKSVRVWDLSTEAVVRVLEGHTKGVNAVAYSPDGAYVASGSDDSSVRVWDLFPARRTRYVRQKDSEGQYTGWLLSPSDSSLHLMFIPPAAQLPDDSNVLTLPTSATPHLDFSNGKLGYRWTECYTPKSL